MTAMFPQKVVAKRNKMWVWISAIYLAMNLPAYILKFLSGEVFKMPDGVGYFIFFCSTCVISLAIYTFVTGFNKPKEVFTIDTYANTIYLHEENKYLNVLDIISINGVVRTGKNTGQIIIVTRTQKYKFKNIKNCGGIVRIVRWIRDDELKKHGMN